MAWDKVLRQGHEGLAFSSGHSEDEVFWVCSERLLLKQQEQAGLGISAEAKALLRSHLSLGNAGALAPHRSPGD